MEWRDEGIMLGVRRHGETSAIAEIMTRQHGRHMGLVRGGRGRRLQPVLQPGNRVEATWRARLHEQLGTFRIEPLELRAASLLADAVAVYGLQTAAAHLRLLPERDPHPGLFEAFGVILAHLEESEHAALLLLRLELAMLEELGFGLDLAHCAVTGTQEELAYVSPRSGRAVSRAAGEPWRDKLLVLPTCLTAAPHGGIEASDLEAGFRLTGHFLFRHVYEPRGQPAPDARDGFLKAVGRALRSRRP